MAFKSIFIDGKISNPATGNVIHLNLMGEETLPYLESIEISTERGCNTHMSITLAPPYDKAIELLSKDNEWLRFGNTLGLRWGYADVIGSVTDWYYGFMQMPDVSFGDEISITVPATSLAWNADRVERARDWCSGESKKTFKEVVEEIAKRYSLIAEFGELDPLVSEQFEEPRESMVQGGMTDLQFMSQMAEKFAARMISHNQYLHFVNANDPLSAFPDVNAIFQMYGKIDIWNNTFPMLSFEPESMGTMFIKNFQGTNALAYGPNDDPAEKKEPAVANDKDAQGNSFSGPDTISNPPGADGRPPSDMEDVQTKATIAVDPTADEGGKVFCLPLNGEESKSFIDGILNGVHNAHAEDHGISVSFSCFGIPNLLPGMFVRLQGVGDYFSGVYMLQKVTVSIGSGGAEMNCEAFARGFPAVRAEFDPFFASVVKSKEPVDNTVFDSLITEEKKPTEQ